MIAKESKLCAFIACVVVNENWNVRPMPTTQFQLQLDKWRRTIGADNDPNFRRPGNLNGFMLCWRDYDVHPPGYCKVKDIVRRPQGGRIRQHKQIYIGHQAESATRRPLTIG